MENRFRFRVLAWLLFLAIAVQAVVPGLVNAQNSPVDSGGIVSDDIDYTNYLELATQFHIFSREAEITVHANGNVATKLLKAKSNFGTNMYYGERGQLDKEIHYLQNIDQIPNSAFVKSEDYRSTKVVFGGDVELELVDNRNALSANGTKLDNLLVEDAYQDKDGNVYIDFDKAFAALEGESNALRKPGSEGVIFNLQEMNRRSIDVSQANTVSVAPVTLLKTDERGNPLPNAVFDLYKGTPSNGVVLETDLITGADGTVELSLPGGEYYFQETTAPLGYTLSTEPHSFEVQAEVSDYIYVDLKASELAGDTPLTIKGLNSNGPSVIINVDMDDSTTLDIRSQIYVEIDDVSREYKETEDFSDAVLLWNFPNDTKTIKVHTSFHGSILATGADVTTYSNFDGSIIADSVHIASGESHRWDYRTMSASAVEPLVVEVTNEPEVTETTTESTTESTTEPTTESTTEPTTEPTTESTTEPTTESTTEPTTESTTEPTTESTTEPTTESTTEPTTESTTEPTTESTTEPTTESTTEPTTESTTEPTTESTTEPTTESTTVPTTESTTEPTTESTTEPTTESTTEPTTESTTEPTTESTTESTTEPTTESTTEPTTESTTEPTTESTTEPTTESTTEPTTESTTEPTTESTTEPTTESTTEPTTESTTEPTTESTTEPTSPAGTEPSDPGGPTDPDQPIEVPIIGGYFPNYVYTLLLLAGAALGVGGYLVVRKSKKSEENDAA